LDISSRKQVAVGGGKEGEGEGEDERRQARPGTDRSVVWKKREQVGQFSQFSHCCCVGVVVVGASQARLVAASQPASQQPAVEKAGMNEGWKQKKKKKGRKCWLREGTRWLA
jgi:hypothetical protein